MTEGKTSFIIKMKELTKEQEDYLLEIYREVESFD